MSMLVSGRVWLDNTDPNEGTQNILPPILAHKHTPSNVQALRAQLSKILMRKSKA